MKKFLLTIFLLLCPVNLWAEYTYSTNLIYLTKPLLVTVLAIWFALETSLKNTFSKLIFGGLVFSIGGDTLLMFVENGRGEHFFLLGLGSFLITHVLYFLAFYNYKKESPGLLRKRPLLALPLLLYFLAFSFYLLPDVAAEMQIPVAVYSLAIISMALSCLNLYGKIEHSVFKLLFIGVLLFVFSDTVIALNKFKADQISIPFARIVIMVLYLLGQYLITVNTAKVSHNQ